jgi:phenylalanyl-tRNA synthetase beta chain
MRLSYNWLASLVSLAQQTPEKVAADLIACGLEIEGELESVGPAFSGVNVALVKALAPHPNADKLRLATVSLGAAAAELQVVCGAKNLKEGQLIAFAQLGAKVFSPKQNEWFTLVPTQIRGVESAGMICSLGELALEAQFTAPEEEGIWPLNALLTDSAIGLPLAEALGLKQDTLLHSAPTANRGDLMAYVGVARELAALYDETVSLPSLGQALPEPATGSLKSLTLSEPSPELCPFYSALLVENVKIGASPEWMVQRLQASGLKTINNVVDITNYVMLELGQPLHAFDRSKLLPSQTSEQVTLEQMISVRRAKTGETLLTLENQERTLSEEALVITCNDVPVALAGVMGGLSSAIDEQTQTVVLECAFFPAALVRKSARSVGLRSESSARFERGVDRAAALQALQRAAFLLTEHAGATVTGLLSVGSTGVERKTIALSLERLSRLAGCSYEAVQVEKTLAALGFVLQKQEDASYLVDVPSYRQNDVSQEADLIEEVLRIQGYASVPATLPVMAVAPASSARQNWLQALHTTLRGLGLQEVSTASLVGPAWLEGWGMPLETHLEVAVANSHSQEHTHMRQRLLPSLLEVAKHNLLNSQSAVWIYELGRTYFKRGPASKKQSGVQEALRLAGFLTGQQGAPTWHQGAAASFYTAKGTLESLMTSLGFLQEAQVQEAPQAKTQTKSSPLAYRFETPTPEAKSYSGFKLHEGFHPGQCAVLVWADTGKPFAAVGTLHPRQSKQLKNKAPMLGFELDAETLWKRCQTSLNQQPQPVSISAFQPSERDMAVLVPDSVSYGQLLQALQALKATDATASETLASIALFDVYEGEHVPKGSRSLALRLRFQAMDKTLTDKEVDGAMAHLKTGLQAALPVSFR